MYQETTQGIYSIDKLKECYMKGIRFNFVYFYSFDEKDINLDPVSKGCFSQFFPASFTDKEGLEYTNAVQYMMAQKALLFKDQTSFNQIMQTSNSKQICEIGQKVKNFNEFEWGQFSQDIVYQGNIYKFSQNKRLKEFMLSFPPNSIFVNADPNDDKWGVHLTSSDRFIVNPFNWRGYNKLGFQLTRVRDKFLSLVTTKVSSQEVTECIYNLESLKRASSQGHRFNFVYFFNFTASTEFRQMDESCLAQNYPSQFEDKFGNVFNSSIQYMMAQKAILFNDVSSFNSIIKKSDPNQTTHLGRLVKNFNQQRWDEFSDEIVFNGNLLKFSQNDLLLQFLMSFPLNTIFVEANPTDGIWGIHLSASHPDARNPFAWKGYNRLGFQVTRVRDTFLKASCNRRFISYAYDDAISSICFSESIESLDLLSTGVTSVYLDKYPNLKQIRISKCRAVQKIEITDMPNLQSVDLLDNPELLNVSFKNCPALVSLEVGFCPKLTRLTGISSIKYLSAPCCRSLESLELPKQIVFLDVNDVRSLDINQIIRSQKFLECLSASDSWPIRLSDITSCKSLQIVHLRSTKIICDSVCSRTNLKIILMDESTDISESFEGDLNLLNNFYVSNQSSANKNLYNFRMFNEFVPEYQKFQKMFYGRWGIPKIDLVTSTVGVKPIIYPPKEVNSSKAADAILGSIFGSAVMDMIGVGVEFIPNGIAKGLLLGSPNITWSHPRCNPHNERFVRGTPTDDTSQCVLIMRSIIDVNSKPSASPSLINVNNVNFDPCDFGKKLLDWINNGHKEHKHDGGLGCGSTTYNVVSNRAFSYDPLKASEEAWIKSGRKVAPNGSVMRIASTGCFAFWDENVVVGIADCYTRVTHSDPRCVFSSISAALLIARYIKWNSGLASSEPNIDATLADAKKIVPNINKYFKDVDFYTNCQTVEELRLSEEGKIGYSLKALGAGIWALRYCSSFEDALAKVVKEGGDSDTNGAVVGALLGAKLGFHSIPNEYIDLMFTGQWLYNETAPFMKLMGIEMPPSPYIK